MAGIRAFVLEAAEAFDAHAAALPDALVQAAQDADLPRTLDRSIHRAGHLDPIEAAFADSGELTRPEHDEGPGRSDPGLRTSADAPRGPAQCGRARSPCRRRAASAGIADLGSGLSVIMASVVRTIAAIDAAFSTAERVTLAGSTMPALEHVARTRRSSRCSRWSCDFLLGLARGGRSR